MGFYLDSAERDEIQTALRLPFVAGVTTNPTLVARATGRKLDGDGYLEFLRGLLDLGPGRFFAQVPELPRDEMLLFAERLHLLAPERLVLKVPCTPDGLELAATLARRGVAAAVTAVFALTQAVAAAETGAGWVAPYCHRYSEQAGDGIALVDGISSALARRGLATRVLVASIKSAGEVEQLLGIGAHDLTMPRAVLGELHRHPLTDDALARFRADLPL